MLRSYLDLRLTRARLVLFVLLILALGGLRGGESHADPALTFRPIECGRDSLPTTAIRGQGSDNVNPCLIGKGNFGIGTLKPKEKLHVAGNLLLEGALTCPACLLRAGESGPIVFETASGEVMRLTAPGNVGIGTPSPQAKLHVVGPVAINSPSLRDEELHIAARDGSSDTAISLENHGNVFELHVQSDNKFAITTSEEVPYLTIDGATGNVGIGTSAPRADLHVVGDFLATGLKGFVQDAPTDPDQQILYVSLEGPEAGTYIRGTAHLIGGEAIIELPEHFRWVTAEEGLTVQLTPLGEWLQLYVVEKSTRRIVVREARGKDGRFDYLVQGVRRGFEGFRPLQRRSPQELPRSQNRAAEERLTHE